MAYSIASWGPCLCSQTCSQYVQIPPDKWNSEIWASTSTQRDHSLAYVSLSHPLVNLPEVFSRLGGRLEAETWLSLGLVVKNHIPSTAPQNLKAGVSVAISATGWGNWYEWPGQHLHQEVLHPAPQSQQSKSYIIAPIVFAQTSH